MGWQREYDNTVSNDALERAAKVADGFVKANAILNGNEPEATIATATAMAVAKQIRDLKS